MIPRASFFIKRQGRKGRLSLSLYGVTISLERLPLIMKAIASFDITNTELAKDVKKRVFADTILLDTTG